MSFWKSIFGKGSIPPEERCEHIDESDVDRVSCMDVVRIIRDRVATFRRSKGMVVVLLEGCRVQIISFDGISRTSWGYNNHQFSTDRVGETFLVGPPTEISLTVKTEGLLPDVIKREFASCDMSVEPLWKLDPTAWDYEAMKVLHGGDVGIRISFDSLQNVASNLRGLRMEHMHTPFCATIIGFSSTQESSFEDTLRQAADSLPITVRSGRSVSNISYPVAVIHAIVLTPKAIADVSGADVETVQSATNLGTCRLYLTDEAGSPSSTEASRLDEFIQRTQTHGNNELAKEIISFFKEADILNRYSTLRAFRDMTCIVMFMILKYLWPISYLYAALHILNAMTAFAGREAWMNQYPGNYVVSASTFFGAFFIAHCLFVVTRNWLFAVRIAKKALSAFAWGAASIMTAAVATAYSMAITDTSISHNLTSATLSVAAYAVYMYARRIRAECTSLSQLQAVMSNPQHRNELLKNIGRQRFGNSAFPLFPFRSRSLFVSYMHGSQWSSDTATLVQDWASKHGLEVFIDRSTIPSGSLWRKSLLRAISECGFFVAVIDGDAPITEWVLAESTYTALLRKSIGKPRVLLIVQYAQRIADNNQNPVQLIYHDVFQLPPDRCFGAAILPIGGERKLTEEQFLRALKGIRPMCLVSQLAYQWRGYESPR